MVEELVKTIPNHHRNLMPRKVPVVKGADSLEDSRQLLFWRFPEADADNL